MKVPTYEAQTARPRQGSGQFLTAQLSASAMTAPGRAFAETGQQLASAGSELAQFAFKKAQIGADNEAQQASAELDVALQQMQLNLLQNPNMQNADAQYKAQSKQLIDQFKGKLSNKLAKDAYAQRALRIQTRNQTSFSKANNARVVQQRTVLLDQDTNNLLTFATDLNNSFALRATAAADALSAIEDAAGDLGPEEVKKRQDKFYYSLARDSLIKAIDGGEDAETVINEFRDNKSRDQVVGAARQNLQQDDVDKITRDLNSRSERLRTLSERKQKGQRELVTLDFDTNLKNMIADMKVNADMTDDTVSQNFMTQTDQMMTDAVDAHQGTAESKAELSIQLKKLRSRHSINIGELQATARRDNAKRALGTDLRALVADVSRDPLQLATSLETLDKSINERASTFLNTEEEENARQGGREDIIQSALDGHLARGQINDMRELYYSPGIQASLTPALQEEYRNKIREEDVKQNKSLREYRDKVKLFEEASGRKPTAQEKLRLAGSDFTPDTKNMDPGAAFRKEFNALSKRFIEVQDSYGRVKLAGDVTAENRIAGDFSLIFNFMKMLDPGVVRESEFRTIAEAGGLPAQLQSGYNRLKGNKLLPDNLRAQYLKMAKSTYDSAVRKQTGLQTQYTDLAKRLKYDPQNVITKFIGLGINPIQTPQPRGSEDGIGTSAETTSGAPAPDQAPVQLDASGNRIN